MRYFAVRYRKADGTKAHYHQQAESKEAALALHEQNYPGTTHAEVIEVTPPTKVTGIYMALAVDKKGKEEAIIIDVKDKQTPLISFSGTVDEEAKMESIVKTCEQIATHRDTTVVLIHLGERKEVNRFESKAVTIICPGCGKEAKVSAHSRPDPDSPELELTGGPGGKDLMVCDACLSFIAWKDGVAYAPTYEQLNSGVWDDTAIESIYSLRRQYREDKREREEREEMMRSAGGLLDALGIRRRPGSGRIEVVDEPIPPGRFHA